MRAISKGGIRYILLQLLNSLHLCFSCSWSILCGIKNLCWFLSTNWDWLFETSPWSKMWMNEWMNRIFFSHMWFSRKTHLWSFLESSQNTRSECLYFGGKVKLIICLQNQKSEQSSVWKVKHLQDQVWDWKVKLLQDQVSEKSSRERFSSSAMEQFTDGPPSKMFCPWCSGQQNLHLLPYSSQQGCSKLFNFIQNCTPSSFHFQMSFSFGWLQKLNVHIEKAQPKSRTTPSQSVLSSFPWLLGPVSPCERVNRTLVPFTGSCKWSPLVLPSEEVGPIHKALKSTAFPLMQKIFILKDLEGLSEFRLLAPVEVLGMVEGMC